MISHIGAIPSAPALKGWLDMEEFFGHNKPWVIAGPCSAENESQLFDTACALSDEGVRVFRAGLWKPRTRPGHFEGVGERGIPWLLRIRSELGMKVCTEVAGAPHVMKCLDSGVDMLWIGARTTTNPFLMQEIAEALAGSAVPVLVKNPINADISLWVGAVERLMRAGVKNIGLIHRGFSSFEKIRFRNAPQWIIAAEMRMKFPGLPMFCDPSHMGGDAGIVPELSQRALDLGFDGLMVECHIKPSEALSDAAQQMLPEHLGKMLRSLNVRKTVSENENFVREISELRHRIDAIDDSLLEVLGRRMAVSREIGLLKKESNVTILQLTRWEEVLKFALDGSRAYGLDPVFVNNIFNIIHAASIAEQNKIQNDSQDKS